MRRRLSALIQGYKVRRILKCNRQVCMLKQELCDLMKFAKILRGEINEATN